MSLDALNLSLFRFARCDFRVYRIYIVARTFFLEAGLSENRLKPGQKNLHLTRLEDLEAISVDF